MIYVIVKRSRITTGHGESADMLILAGKAYEETKTFPAFRSRELATEWLHVNKGKLATWYEIHEMELL